MITGGDEVCILPPPTLSEKGVGVPTLSISLNIISVQYNGGLIPDIILLTQGYYHWGTRLNTM